MPPRPISKHYSHANKLSVTPADLTIAFVLAIVIFGLNFANLYLDWDVLLWLYVVRLVVYLFAGYQTAVTFRRRHGGPLNLIRPHLAKAGAAAGLTTAGLGWGVFLILFLIVTLAGGDFGINVRTASLGLNVVLGIVEIILALLLGAGGAKFYKV